MSSASSNAPKPRFCSECGTQLHPNARFCHACAAPVGGRPAAAPVAEKTDVAKALRWGVPIAAFFVLMMISVYQFASRTPPDASGMVTAGAPPVAGPAGAAPDISSMSPEERADRLFNRVMRLSSEGKNDSAAFFAPMALSALESLAPLDAHRRYDIGLVALVAGAFDAAAAQADTILLQRKTHLLGLALGIRAAEARGNAAVAKDLRRRLLAAEATERSSSLQEYKDHEADVLAAIQAARKS